MTNYEIADRFTRIADALEIQGENPFKVRAYRNAAATIAELEDSLEEISARGKLGELPGFGAGILGITGDFLSKGTTPLWEEVITRVPVGVVQMASVPGIGPKTVKTLWESLQVSTVAELLQAAKEGRVRAVPGFGAAKEAKFIEKIEAWYRLSERAPRFLALSLAQRWSRELERRPEVRQVMIAGELRRGCDLVSEARLAVVSSAPAATLKAAAEMPGVVAVRSSEGAAITVETEAGIRVALTATEAPATSEESDLGWFLLEQTGPAEFLQEMEARKPGGALPEEKTVFSRMGLPEIAPELRHWPRILERAERGELPQLLEEADFKGQLHQHSTWSDGTASLREMAEAARARGYQYLAITDHSRSLTIASGLSRERHLAQLEEIAELNREFAGQFTLLAGLEADILQDGSLDCDPDILERLDLVVGSVHIRYKEDAAAMTERICKALENPYLTILGHPTGRLLGRREPYPVDMETVIACAARNKKALEINASPERMDLNDTYALRAREQGALLSINADAHSIRGLGLLPWGLCMARRAGATAEEVINTYSLERLQAEVLRKK